MNFDKIQEKYNYNEEFSNFLRQVYEECVRYFGSEEIIYEAFMATPIVNATSVYDFLKENDLLEDFDGNLSAGDLKRAAGVYHSLPIVEYDNTTNTYNIVDVKRHVITVDFSLEKDHTKATLIHELCHLIKSYVNEFEIQGDILIVRSGLITETYKLTNEDGKVKMTLISTKGVGIEEGITSVNEEDITRNIVNPDYRVSGYGVINSIARNVLDNEHMKNIFLNAELYKNKDELFNEINGEAYEKFENITDRVYKLTLKMFSEIFNPEKMQLTSAELDKILKEEYALVINEMYTNRSMK